MTRFARAKGSKASNLKSPEDSTPWEVMKEHMLKAKNDNEECKKREEAEQQRIENYNNFLKEQRVQKRKATWCDFPESESSTNSKSKANKTKGKQEKKAKTAMKQEQTEIEIKKSHSDTNGLDVEESNISKKKKKKHNKNNTAIHEDHKDNNVLPPTEQSITTNEKKGKKKQKLSLSASDPNDASQKDMQNISNDESGLIKKSKKKKKKNKDSLAEPEVNKTTNIKATTTGTDKPDEQAKITKKGKNKGTKNSKPNRRKPVNDKSFQLIINGKEVQLVRFDGFPIMKKDAERLEELKKSMIKKGIPKSEVQRTMKLERRRAEKALARVKRDVCYNCRKGGHNLSDCPDLKSNIPGVDAAEGVCFKCGSTEHRQFECKVQREKEFRFATCFICKESGHIARQCPDNPKGLYPNGGSCKLCGDVTHLRKDCPTVKDKKEETSIKLQTLNDDNIEDIGYQPKSTPQETSKKPKKIKF